MTKDEILNLRNKWTNENILKLSMIYNNKGEFREIRLNLKEANKLSQSYLNEMIKNVNLKKSSNKFQKLSSKKNIYIEKVKDIYNNIKLVKSIDNVVNTIQQLIGENEIINNVEFNLDKQVLNLKNDYLGSKIRNSVRLNLDDKKVSIIEMNDLKYFQIYDIRNNKNLLFNYFTNLYVGYFDKKIFKKINSNKYLHYIPSLKELLETFGITKNFYIFENSNDIKYQINEIITKIISTIKEIKQNIFKIRYKKVDRQINPIINSFVNKISKINLSKKSRSIFDKIDTFYKFEKINYKFEFNKYYSKYEIIDKVNVLNKLINYFIDDISFILDINSEKYTKINFIRFIFSSIISSYENELFKANNIDIIRYKYILKSDILEAIRDTYIYTDEELLENKLSEEDMENRNELINDQNEQNDALDAYQDQDIDSYDEEGEEMVEFNESEGYNNDNAINLKFTYGFE